MVEGALINAVYALYGLPEPRPETSTDYLRTELNAMADRRRRQDAIIQERLGKQPIEGE
jgi:hypothetical protein